MDDHSLRVTFVWLTTTHVRQVSYVHACTFVYEKLHTHGTEVIEKYTFQGWDRFPEPIYLIPHWFL